MGTSGLTKNPTLSHKNPDGTWYFEGTSTNQYARLFQETNKRQQQTTSIDGEASLEITWSQEHLSSGHWSATVISMGPIESWRLNHL